jgi:nucleoside-diphosphate-sugar epimerase
MARIVITGASGFVGLQAVEAARAAGHDVVALGRRDRNELATDTYHALDLGAPGAAEALVPILDGSDAVIHAAAAMAGDDAAQERGTLAPMRAVLDALGALSRPMRLVLVSSFSVYGFASMPEGALLTELTPLEPEPHKRDAYTRAKLTQEDMAVNTARTDDLDLWLIRPGAIYGPGQLDTARLGFAIRGRRLSPGGDPAIPAVDVARVGEGLVAAATVPRPLDRDVSGPLRHPAVVINLTDPDPPRQSEWAGAAGFKVMRLPKSLLFRTAAALDLAGDLAPGLGARLPGAILPPRLAARFRHLRYSTQRMEDILGLAPGPSSKDRLAAYATHVPQSNTLISLSYR